MTFALAVCLACLSSRQRQWEPVALVVILLGLSVVSDLLTLSFRSVLLSGSFIALVVAMALLGPAPAVLVGVVSVMVDALRRRPRTSSLVANLSTYATFPLVGGLLILAARDHWNLTLYDAPFLLLVFGVFFLTNMLNFVLVAAWERAEDGIPLWLRMRTDFLPVLPSELAAALLTVGIVGLYARVGLAALALAAVVLVVFQYLARELLISQDRAAQLERRSEQLASLHVGVLTVMLKSLSLRDRSTARHSAAVARYARELARSMGCSEQEQDLVHTAGLLHDLGKFILPDSILIADRALGPADWELVRRHPAQGAEVVRRVDGYGEVADIILAHHERPDGTGYPRGLRGEDIPFFARMIAVADTYDVLTARDSYRRPVSSEEAVAELRRSAGGQLDTALVEAFAHLLEEKDVAFRHADDADFEAELASERRMDAFFEPTRIGAARLRASAAS